VEPETTQRFRPVDRLRQRVEYLACYERGRAVTGSLLTLHVLPNQLGRPRLGVTATRKAGNAVTRNRLRRRCREVYRRFPRRHELPALDIVVNVRPRAARVTWTEMQRQLERQLETLLDTGRKPGGTRDGPQSPSLRAK
jgi:ribonuclease P protein component